MKNIEKFKKELEKIRITNLCISHLDVYKKLNEDDYIFVILFSTYEEEERKEITGSIISEANKVGFKIDQLIYETPRFLMASFTINK